MKRAFISLFFFAALASVAVGQNANDWFITVWDLSKPTDRTNDDPASTIAFPGVGSGYKLYWEDVDNASINGTEPPVSSNGASNPYYLPIPPGTTKVRIKVHKGSGTFSTISHYGWDADPKRLIAVEQWGTTQWATMNKAFYNCENMDVTATDKPDLSQCTSLQGMFHKCSKLVNDNGSISNWNTEKITDMSEVFSYTTLFNKPLNSWETKEVTNMSYMFNFANKFNQPLNTWNTGKVTNMAGMFYNATSFNQSLNSWNTAQVTDMSKMFFAATSFNQSLNFNTANVTNMSYMFRSATSFNQPFGSNFKTDKVTDMSNMFYYATAFNQSLNSWNTAQVTNMSYMFRSATSFNQSLNFNTANVTDMSYMFAEARSFNQPFGSNFKTDKVTNMNSMFYGATSFNQPLNSWTTSNVTSMDGMFQGATSFNQPLNFNTEKVTAMGGMFAFATSFNQPLTNFNIKHVTYMQNMLSGCGMSCQNLSVTLDNWKTQAQTHNINNIALGDISTVYNAYNEQGRDAITALTATPRNWTITGGQFVPGCILPSYYVSEWDMSKSGVNTTELITNLIGNNFTVEWANLAPPYDNGTITTASGTAASPFKLTGLRANAKYRIIAYSSSATNKLTGLCADKADKQRLTKVTQWGTTKWTSLDKAFFGCGNMDVTATDKPDLTVVTDLSNMFKNCVALVYNTSVNDWDVSHITNMNSMFSQTTKFNQPLNNWVVSSVTDMRAMFASAETFNQDISGWDVSHVTNMIRMFGGAKAFNRDLSNWNVAAVADMSHMFREAIAFNSPLNWGGKVSNVTNMASMFFKATAFNQDISGWNTRSVANMNGMFKQATAFDRDLGSLRIDALTNGTEMFASSGMSCDNYSNTLKGWAESSHTPSNVNFATQTGMTYGRHGKPHRDKLTSQKSWTISGDNLDLACSIGLITPDVFVTEWDLSKPAKDTRPDAATTLFTNFIGTKFVVEYVNLTDPTDKGIVTNASSPPLMTFKLTGLRAGAKYRLIAYPNPNVSGSVFKGQSASSSDAKRLLKVTQWGTNAWTSLAIAFYDCENMDVTATDVPNLSACQNISTMFQGCKSLVYNTSINNWQTANVTDMSRIFKGAMAFNQPLNNWRTANVTNMLSMFEGATSFNQDISGWNTTKVTDMTSMFAKATSFNQDIRGWSTSEVIDMRAMFFGATSFNQPIGNWNTRKVNYFRGMFKDATAFDQPLDGLELNAVYDMEDIIRGCGMSCENLSTTLDGWKTQAATLNKNSISLGALNADQYYNQLGQAAINALRGRGWTITGGTYAQDCITPASWFTTVWDMTKLTIRHFNAPDTTIAFPGLGTNYRIDWEDVDDPTNPAKHGTVTVSSSNGSSNPYYLSVPPGTTKVRIKAHKASGTFNGFWHLPAHTNKTDNNRLIAVEQWGTTKWDVSGLSAAFINCINMDVTATDKPNLSQCTSLSNMFLNCRSLVNTNGSISGWNTENITSMGDMFYKATAFNQPLNSWNTAKVTYMGGMFNGATSFNQPLNSWNTAKVTDMGGMFYGATSFNQPLNNWNTEKVTNMGDMFFGATLFNQDISGWNTENVTNMRRLFRGASSFNRPLNNWNTMNVKSMGEMFQEATSFNQPLGNWDTRNVMVMNEMFQDASSFNQPLNSWNTAKVTTMDKMFEYATSFNQPLDSFKIDAITTMGEMLRGCKMSCENLSITLDSWKTQAATLNKNNIYLGSVLTIPKTYNEMGRDAIAALTARGWTVTGGLFARDCISPDYYVSVWDMSKAGAHPTELTTNLWGGNFRVEWKNLDDGTEGNLPSATATTAPLTITGLTPGKRYRVVAYPNNTPGSILKKLATEDGGGITRTDVARLDSVTQWGANKWMSLEGAFRHCSRMDVTATDKPDLTMLSGNKSLNFMFEGCENLVYNSTINNWVTTGVTDMSGMFSGAKAFNQPLNGWDVSNVKYMTSMFFRAEAFNQDLDSWQTGNVERMQHMFNRAKAFNGNIISWNTGKVTNMQAMFYGAEAFNQSLGWDTENVTDMSSMFQNAKAFNDGSFIMSAMGSWNVEKVTTMKNMFLNADAFDQDLSYWTLKSVTDMESIFKATLNKGMSCKNYSKTLQSWALSPYTNTGINFLGQANRQYNIIGKDARDILMKPVAQGGKGWSINGDTYDLYCGIDYMWTGNVSTDITDTNNWQGGIAPQSEMIPEVSDYVLGPREKTTVAISLTATHDMYIPALPSTPDPQHPGHSPDKLYGWSWGNMINNTTKRVVIMPGANLCIRNWVIGASTPADVDKIVVKADSIHPNGALILTGHPCDKPVYATVEMYSKARKNPTPDTWTDDIDDSPTKGTLFTASYRWQFIGIPVEGEVANAFYGSYLRKYDETYNAPNQYYRKWRKIGANETWQPLVPFAGYEVTSLTPKIYVFKGRLLHCPQELTLTRQAAEVTAVASSVTDPRKRHWGLGQNVVGNSYTHAITTYRGIIWQELHPNKYSDLDSMPIEATIYLYNTGNIAEWAGGSTWSGAGSWEAVPTNIVTYRKSQSIPSMQGFMIKFRDDTLQLKGVGDPVKFKIGIENEYYAYYGGNQQPQRAPQADPSDKIHGYLKVGLTSRRSASFVELVEAEGTTDEFDNGWDGMQLNTGRSSSATLFVPSAYGDLQVSTSDNIVGDRFGIVNNGDTAYRLTVIRHRLDNRGDLYLYDVATNRYTLLDADTTVYDFTSEGSGNVDKRFVITDRRNADDPNTAVDEVADDLSLYGYIDGRNTLVVNNHTSEAGTLTLLDVSGKAVYSSPFGVGFSRHDLSHLPAGVYIARLEASVRRATVKAITMK